MSERVWIPAVPLPFMFVGHDRCGSCGRRFFGRRPARRHRYEVHWRREHEPRDEATGAGIFMEVAREEADRIYAEAHGGRRASAA